MTFRCQDTCCIVVPCGWLHFLAFPITHTFCHSITFCRPLANKSPNQTSLRKFSAGEITCSECEFDFLCTRPPSLTAFHSRSGWSRPFSTDFVPIWRNLGEWQPRESKKTKDDRLWRKRCRQDKSRLISSDEMRQDSRAQLTFECLDQRRWMANCVAQLFIPLWNESLDGKYG